MRWFAAPRVDFAYAPAIVPGLRSVSKAAIFRATTRQERGALKMRPHEVAFERVVMPSVMFGRMALPSPEHRPTWHIAVETSVHHNVVKP